MKRIGGLLLILVIFVFFQSSCGKAKRKTIPGPNDKVFSVSVAEAVKKDVPNVVKQEGRFIPLNRLEVKSDFTGKIQALSVEEGQNVLSGDVLLKIEDEKLPWILERQRASLKEAEAQLDYDERRGVAGGPSDALEEAPEDEEEDEEPLEDEEGPEGDEPDQAEEDAEEEIDEGEDETPMQRLARLRRNAQRARQAAQRRAQQRQQPAAQPAQTQESAEEAESRRALDEAKIERIRAEMTLTEKQIDGSTLTTGIDGFVTKVEVNEGSVVKPQDFLMEIITIDPIDLSLKIPKGEINEIDKKMSVKVTVPDLGSQNFEGEISFIGAELEQGQQSVEVRIRVNNPKLKIKSGMEGIAEMAVQGASHKAIMVPRDAIVYQEKKSYVYVLNGQLAERLEVQTGATTNGDVEIKRGIRVKDKVITRGVDQLKGPSEFVRVQS